MLRRLAEVFPQVPRLAVIATAAFKGLAEALPAGRDTGRAAWDANKDRSVLARVYCGEKGSLT